MPADVKKQIIGARPSLRNILPVVYWSTVVFTFIMLAISCGLFAWKPTIFPLVARNNFLIDLWAYAYLGVGMALIWGLHGKHWEQLRSIMSCSFLFNIMWSFALFFRITDGGTLLLAVLWLGVTALQAVLILFYLPPTELEPYDGVRSGT